MFSGKIVLLYPPTTVYQYITILPEENSSLRTSDLLFGLFNDFDSFWRRRRGMVVDAIRATDSNAEDSANALKSLASSLKKTFLSFP